MAVIALEDLEGSVEVVIFPDAYKEAGELYEDRIVWIEGIVKTQSERQQKSGFR